MRSVIAITNAITASAVELKARMKKWKIDCAVRTRELKHRLNSKLQANPKNVSKVKEEIYICSVCMLIYTCMTLRYHEALLWLVFPQHTCFHSYRRASEAGGRERARDWIATRSGRNNATSLLHLQSLYPLTFAFVQSPAIFLFLAPFNDLKRK